MGNLFFFKNCSTNKKSTTNYIPVQGESFIEYNSDRSYLKKCRSSLEMANEKEKFIHIAEKDK